MAVPCRTAKGMKKARLCRILHTGLYGALSQQLNKLLVAPYSKQTRHNQITYPTPKMHLLPQETPYHVSQSISGYHNFLLLTCILNWTPAKS